MLLHIIYLLASVNAGSQVNVTGNLKTLQEVYGDVVEPTELLSWAERAPTAERMSIALSDKCTFPFEVLLVQDLTDSFAPHTQNMRETQLPQLVAEMKEEHPGSSFGAVSFRDKPIWPLGDPASDYCVHFETPLNSDPQPLYDAYGRMVATGGGDPPENSFGALMAAAQSSTPGWSNKDATRLIIVITDAAPHFGGDGLNDYQLKASSGVFDEPNNAEQCKREYYPDADQVAAAIHARRAYVAFLIYDAHGAPSDSWKWFNSYIGQTPDFVEDLGADSVGFWKSLSKIIDKIEQTECGPSTTYTPTDVTSHHDTSADAEPSTQDQDATTHTSMFNGTLLGSTELRSEITSPHPSEIPTLQPTESLTPTPTSMEVLTSSDISIWSEDIYTLSTIEPSKSTRTSFTMFYESTECPEECKCECDCQDTECGCDVDIRVLHRPKRLVLNIDN